MRIFKSFCENNSEKVRVLQEYTKKARFLANLLSSVFYLLVSIFVVFVSYPSIF